MALRGNLKDFSLPDVFQLVTFSKKTGVLRIKREDGAEGSVWFRDGDVFFAQSNWRAEPLGERLVRAQRITEQALGKGLKIRAQEGDDGRRLGTILVDEGYITEKVLEAFVSDQIQDTIFDLMRWDEGDFDFEAMPDVVEEDIGLTVSIENVVMEGSRRLEEWTRIKKKIPSMDVVFKMATAPGEGTFEISLKPMEWQLLLLVDSTRSVADLAVETDRTDFEVARIVYGLFSAGLLEFATDEEVEKSRAERAEREAKLAEIEQQRRAQRQAAEAKKAEEARAAEKAAAEKAAAEKAAADKAAAEKAAQTAAAASSAAPQPAAQVEPTTQAEPAAQAEPTKERKPAEEPSFLGGAAAGPSAEDAAVLEAFMGAVLERPAPSSPAEQEQPPAAPPVAPHVPAEEPAFMAVEHEEVDVAGIAIPSVEDIIPGLGIAPAAPAEETAVEAQPEPVIPVEPVSPLLAPEGEPSVTSVPEATTEASEAQPLDLSAMGSQVLGAIPDFLMPAESAEPELASASTETSGERTETPAVSSEIPAAPVFEAGPAEDFTFATPVPAEAEADEEHDFERDLMSLGLGELPSDLLGVEGEGGLNLPEVTPVPPPAPVVPEPEPFDLLPVSEPMSAMGEAAAQQDVELGAADDDIARLQADLSLPSELPQEPAASAVQEEEPDFSELLLSLDVDASEAEVEVEAIDAGFDAELLREEPAASGGVISTDAFLDDIDDIGMAGSLNDELSALTGLGGRPSRPQASVNKIPDAGSAVLRRDTRVDKETLLKIIDGIQSL